jgi:beta-aspartyl-peptidase (threonine type)
LKNIQFILGGIAFIFVEFLAIPQSIDTKPKEEYALIIHGGTGPITRKNMTAKKETAYRDKLEEALQTGYKILNAGGSARDAVEGTIHVMEASPLFNAGKGAVFTNAGTNELNASIMDGSNLKVGAVLAMYLS